MRVTRPAPVGRLTKRPEFLAAAAGRRFHTGRMTLQGRLRGDVETVSGLRVGFTLTKRVGGAVVRNRIRRRLRAALAEVGPGHRTASLDVVVVGRIDALACPFDLLVADLDRGIDAVARPKTPRPPADPGPGDQARNAGPQARNAGHEARNAGQARAPGQAARTSPGGTART